MPHEKFDVSKLERLNDPARLVYLDPDALWAAASVSEPRSIVDVGAGTGVFSAHFARFAPAAEVFAVDTEPAMVRWMLDHRPDELCARLHPMLAGESSIPLPTGEADLVVMINLHHELADPISSYREAMRLLRIGGTILIADWKPEDTAGGPPQHVRVTAAHIAELLSRVGFDTITHHDTLSKHSLITGRKPAVCGL